jgi:hypothetical protein
MNEEGCCTGPRAKAAMRRFVVGVTVALSVVTGLSAGVGSATTKTAGIVSASDDPTTAASETLLSSLARGDRERCYQRDQATMANGEYADAIAAVECDDTADGITAALYIQYDDAAKLAARYAASVPPNLPASAGSSSDACDGTDTWNYDDGAAGGRSACFTETTGTTMVWTATTPLVLGIVGGKDGTTVKKWWNKSSGPLETPDDVTNFAPAGPAANATATKALLAGTGKSLTGCKSHLQLVAGATPNGRGFPGSSRRRPATGHSTDRCTSPSSTPARPGRTRPTS